MAAQFALLLLAALTMCLQGFVSASATPAGRASLATISVHGGDSAICAPAADGGDTGAPCDHAHQHCCLPGESCADWASPAVVPVASPSGVAVAAPGRSLRLRRPPSRAPAGWASSWSAQAPPHFSRSFARAA